MNIEIDGSFFLLLVTLLLTSCLKNKERHLIFEDSKPNQIDFELDSIRYPPKMAFFPIRLTFTNYSNKKAVLAFKTIDSGFKYQKQNLFFVSGVDTMFLGINASYIILEKYSSTSFNIEGYYDFGDLKRKHLFNDFHNFPKGKIIYKVNSDELNNLNNKVLKQDTLLVPKYLESSTENGKVVFEFSRNSMKTQIQPLKR